MIEPANDSCPLPAAFAGWLKLLAACSSLRASTRGPTSLAQFTALCFQARQLRAASSQHWARRAREWSVLEFKSALSSISVLVCTVIVLFPLLCIPNLKPVLLSGFPHPVNHALIRSSRV